MTYPCYSLIIEWENAKLAELDRAHAMLKAVSAQAAALKAEMLDTPEMMVLYDETTIDPALILQGLEQTLDPKALTVTLLPVGEAGYYGQKEIGAKRAKGDFIIFLDSDVIPEEGWLKGLLDGVLEGKDVVGGQTYMEASDFWGRSFALFWFFPKRSDAQGIEQVHHVCVNNIIMRKETFLRYGFPENDAYRGHCVLMFEQMDRAGEPLYRQNSARVSHPAPNGFLNILRRAWWEGRDAYLIGEARHHRNFESPYRNAGKRFLTQMVRAKRRFQRDYKTVGFSAPEAVLAFAFVGSYLTIYLVAEMVTAARLHHKQKTPKTVASASTASA